MASCFSAPPHLRVTKNSLRAGIARRTLRRYPDTMRTFLLTLACILAASTARAEPFEIKDGDRVLFLGDTLLEREGTYGYLETRMVEQFADRKFTVRNLAFSADTPLGWSRASFDPAAKGFERLKEQLALVKPTVVFLGYGMAASLQEMTDRSQDWTLNRDPARYGAEPMTPARFKKELAQLMDAIGKDARFVLLSPIRHEDLRAQRPGLPTPPRTTSCSPSMPRPSRNWRRSAGRGLSAPWTARKIVFIADMTTPRTESICRKQATATSLDTLASNSAGKLV